MKTQDIKKQPMYFKIEKTIYELKNCNGSPYTKKVTKQEAEKIKKNSVGMFIIEYKQTFVVDEMTLQAMKGLGTEFKIISHLQLDKNKILRVINQH
jgi:hypothetical protein